MSRRNVWLVIGTAVVVVVAVMVYVAWRSSPRAGQCGRQTAPGVIERGVPCDSAQATHEIVEVVRSGGSVCPSGIVTHEGSTGICWQVNTERPMATIEPPPSP